MGISTLDSIYSYKFSKESGRVFDPSIRHIRLSSMIRWAISSESMIEWKIVLSLWLNEQILWVYDWMKQILWVYDWMNKFFESMIEWTNSSSLSLNETNSSSLWLSETNSSWRKWDWALCLLATYPTCLALGLCCFFLNFCSFGKLNVWQLGIC